MNSDHSSGKLRKNSPKLETTALEGRTKAVLHGLDSLKPNKCHRHWLLKIISPSLLGTTLFSLFAAIVSVMLTGPVSAAAGEKPFYRAEMIFKPSLRFPRCHSSMIIALPDGSLMAAWWNGSEEAGKDLVIRACRRPAGKETWEPPWIIADTPDTTEGNPVFFAASHDELWLFYRAGFPWAKIMWMKSPDMGKTWGKPAVFLDEPGWTLRNRILRLSNGDIIIPALTRGSPDLNLSRATSIFLYSTDSGRTWKQTGEIISEPGNNEPGLFQRTNGSLLAYMRPYDPEPAERFLWKSESSDNGRTWSKATRTRLRNPSSAIELLKLRNGSVVLAFNDSQEMRSPLCLALSVDDGLTWSYKRVLEDAPGRFSYPALTQAGDGKVHVSYTFRRTHIKHVELNQAWIMQKPWPDYPDN